VTRDFAAKTAIVTGGAQGIVAAYARQLGARGACVVVSDIQAEKAAAVAEEITKSGGQAIGVACDVGSPESCGACARAAIERFGGIDCLVSNAGLLTAAFERPLHQIEPERYRRVFEVMAHGMVWMAQAVVPSMRARGGGAIVNTSSIGAWQARGIYSLTKLVVNGITVGLAKELMPDKIRVNAIAPGAVDTEGLRQIMTREQLLLYQQSSGGPADTVASAEDIARVGVFLLSDEARFVSGQIVSVDQATLARL